MVDRRTHLDAAETLDAAERGLARRGKVGSGHGLFSSYDALRRPVSDFVVRDADGSSAVVTHRVWVDEDSEADPGESANAATYHKGRFTAHVSEFLSFWSLRETRGGSRCFCAGLLR